MRSRSRKTNKKIEDEGEEIEIEISSPTLRSPYGGKKQREIERKERGRMMEEKRTGGVKIMVARGGKEKGKMERRIEKICPREGDLRRWLTLLRRFEIWMRWPIRSVGSFIAPGFGLECGVIFSNGKLHR